MVTVVHNIPAQSMFPSARLSGKHFFKTLPTKDYNMSVDIRRTHNVLIRFEAYYMRMFTTWIVIMLCALLCEFWPTFLQKQKL